MGLKEFFELDKYNTTVKTEIIAGATTFLAMAYILIVNPTILSISGMPFGPVIIATIIAAAFATILTGVYAKKPFAMAPYMGENVLFTFSIVLALGVTWQQALGAVFWGGVIFLVVTLLGVRTILAKAVPRFLAASWSIGIGLFLMFVGFSSAGISMPGVPGAPVKIGNLLDIHVLVALAGVVITLALLVKKAPGSILIGILSTMVLAYVAGITVTSPEAKALGFPNWGEVLGKFDPVGALLNPTLIPIILVLFLVDTFDTMGTVLGLGLKAGFIKKNQGDDPGLEKVFHVDALATVFGAIFGTSTVGTFIESATGIEEGGRTGLTSLVTGLLFLAMLPLAPVIAVLNPGFLQLASAPALIAVGILMMSVVQHIDFTDIVQVVPTVITIAFMLFTYNIALGIAAGLVAYPLTALVAGRGREVHPVAWVLLAIALLLFIFYPYPKP